MKNLLLFLIILVSCLPATAQDWKDLAVPVDPGPGKAWEIQPHSDSFNYNAPNNKGTEFFSRWTDFYHNTWTGPGLTVWDRNHVLVKDGQLQIPASRQGTNKVNTGCITSTRRVVYPVYIEARAKLSNSVLASDVWLLSPDDTQEIDILEAYGASWSEGAQKDQKWFDERIHLSHHVFIRNPFQDYQPTDPGSWYYNGTLWRQEYHRYGVYWRDPWHLEYYIDGKLVRTVSGKQIIDPLNYTNGTGLSKEMDIIINMEDQTWRSNQAITPTDGELANRDNHTFRVDWIRVYKPVNEVVTSSAQNPDLEAVRISPNPTAHRLEIECPTHMDTVQLLSPTGQLLKTINTHERKLTLPVQDLPPGPYLIRIKTSQEEDFTRKVIIQ
ncbi:family 16 glycosylhydrolase [Dyadobacter jiangsuensis]